MAHDHNMLIVWLLSLSSQRTRKEKKIKNDFDVTTDVNYGVASFSSWTKSIICNPKTSTMRIGGPPMTNASF
jgi:hypothetical protein